MVLLMPTFLGQAISQHSSWYSVSYSLPASSTMFPEPQMQKLWCKCVYWAGLPTIYWSLHYVQLLITVIISISVKRGFWVVPSGIHESWLMHGGAILPTQQWLFLELPTSQQFFFPLYVLNLKIRCFPSNVFWLWFPPLNLSQIIVLPLYHWY